MKQLKTISEIKRAVDSGLTVKCNGGGYQVIKDNIGQYLIKFLGERDNYIGLTGRWGTQYADQLNATGFYVDEETTTYMDEVLDRYQRFTKIKYRKNIR